MLHGQPCDAALSVVLVGPGTGEAVFVGTPSGDVLAVDSCIVDGKPAAETVLPWLRAKRVGCVLTHPHRDHSAGFAAAVTSARATGGWVACADPNLDPDDDRTESHLERYGKTTTKTALSAIRMAWSADKSLVQVPRRGSVLQLGDLAIRVLHPDEVFLSKEKELNLRSTVLAVDWRGARVLLGSDLELRGWENIAKSSSCKGFRSIKIPHHCSINGIHDYWMNGPVTRSAGCTPFSTQRLPRREGIERVGGGVRGVGVTSVASGRTGRLTLNEAFPSMPPNTSLFNQVQPVTTPGRRKAPWLYTAIDAAGNIVDERLGADAAYVFV